MAAEGRVALSRPPAHPRIYHITHVDNLRGIVAEGQLLSDALVRQRNQRHDVVGIGDIKRRRLNVCEVTCHPGTMVGQYVPFYFCPRSVMLYLLHMGNHPALEYRGGQEKIVHLVADLYEVVKWADEVGVRWAFTDVNAATSYARFFSRVEDLGEIDWSAVEANDWRGPAVKDHKQAEFLVFGSFPWKLVRTIGVIDGEIAEQVRKATGTARHRPAVSVERSWYY